MIVFAKSSPRQRATQADRARARRGTLLDQDAGQDLAIDGDTISVQFQPCAVETLLLYGTQTNTDGR